MFRGVPLRQADAGPWQPCYANAARFTLPRTKLPLRPMSAATFSNRRSFGFFPAFDFCSRANRLQGNKPRYAEGIGRSG